MEVMAVMVKWLDIFRIARKTASKRTTKAKIKDDLATYQKWSQRKLSDRLS